MPSQHHPDGVFISCVSEEFEKVGAPFPGLRGQLRGYLARTRSNVRVQEDFPQTAVDTVKKVADEIRPRAVVIHLVGEKPGAIAKPAAVAEFLTAEPNFLAKFPELRSALGDCSGISYTQWEAFIALHHDIPLLVYATDKASAQQTHLDHLTLARVGLILANTLPQPTLDLPHIAAAVNGLRAAGQSFILCSGLLTASLYHFVRGEHDLARKHLAEAQQIAERGPMPLFLADIHLHRARMFHDRDELAKAAKRIRDLGYGRRYGELLDAEQALS